jgi:hypothetical protein
VEALPCFGGVARSALVSHVDNGREIECSSKVVGNRQLHHFNCPQSAAQDSSQPCNKCALVSKSKYLAMRRKQLKRLAKLQTVNHGNASSN